MERWIVEGIRPGAGGWDARVELVEAGDRAEALALVNRMGRMQGFQVSARPARPGDEPAALERQLTAAARDAAEELDRLVNLTARELGLSHHDPGANDR